MLPAELQRQVSQVKRAENSGTPGTPGKDGYTPIKGVDYVDGADGYTPVKGVDYDDGAPGEGLGTHEATYDHPALVTHAGASAPHAGHETPAGAQGKVDTHAAVAAPHSGHETPTGAQTKASGAVAAHEAANNHALLHSNAGDHSHTNKSTLDGYTQTEADLADAVSKKHAAAHDHAGVYEPADAGIQTHVTAAHAPSNAQKNSDITKAEIEAKLTGQISSHSHAADVSAAWPVGSVFISVVSTNPNTLLGFGTWAAFAAGRVLVGLDSGDANFDVVEETGGAKTSTPDAHSGAAVGNHVFTQPSGHSNHVFTQPAGHSNHVFTQPTAHTSVATKQGSSAGNVVTTATHSGGGVDAHSAHTGGSVDAHSAHVGGAVDAHNVTQPAAHAAMSVVQPYVVVYMWKRTA